MCVCAGVNVQVFVFESKCVHVGVCSICSPFLKNEDFIISTKLALAA